MTIKLYDTDSFLWVFTARVLRCEPAGARWRVLLDQTAFFPEGGGQPADPGTLNEIPVLDVQEEAEGIAHYLAAPLPVGETVRGALDGAVRLRRMQNHTGEHILCGLAHRRWGYENVGFHLGEEAVTMDLSGELTPQQLRELELAANRVVWENVPVTAEYPDPEKLPGLTYRSKLELTENVRLVTIQGYDVCACCAPHVKHTGQVGVIKIIDAMRHRGGMRLTILCGVDAYHDYVNRSEQIKTISHLLSTPRDQVAPAVERQLAEKDALHRAIQERERKLIALRAEALPETAGNLCVVDQFDDLDALRELVNAGAAKAGGVCAAFSGTEDAGYRYIIGSRAVDLRAQAASINAALRGRGGGKPTMIQGSCAASKAEIEAFFAQRDFHAAPEKL